ncbi:MAG: hypothetical protein EOL98_07940 [Negativicutes bacterium]|nr:hypothetical protein [Negativicutes bacterium]
MAITNSFLQAVSTSNVKGIRIMMKDSLLVDPTFMEFDEMIRRASNVSGLFDSYDGREFQHDKSKWNDDYMDKLMVQIVGNFSHERIDHLKDVVKYLRPTKTHFQKNSIQSNKYKFEQRQTERPHKPQVRHDQRNNYQKIKRQDQLNGNYRSAKIAAGAVLGGIIAGAAGGAGIVGVVATAAATGALVAIVTKES